jgi:eukaryotic-like serine/threonine-protein kinase
VAWASSISIRLPERYRVTEPIAAGGMAEVWAAHDQALDRPVAVKVLAHHLSADPVARRRFQREARAAAGLSSHPNVVTIYDVGEVDERSFIVMELRAGGTLADNIRPGRPVEPATALAWLRDAAAALDAAHQRGIVHRDIKPANLLLDEHGRVAVADFGIARLAWETQMTATGQVLGTAAYLSPEQAFGDPATPASDRYALAIVAYELLTGTRLFPGAEHFAAQVRAHAEDAPAAPSARNRRLPRAVDDVLLRGLAKEPKRRWPTASAMVEALADAIEGRGPVVAAAAVAPASRAEATAQTIAATAATAPVARPATPTPPARRPAARPSRTTPRSAPASPRRAASRRRLLPGLGLACAALAVGALAVSGGNADKPRGGPRINVSPSPAPAAAQPPPVPLPAPKPAPAPPPQPSGAPAELNDRGFELFKEGRYGEALPFFRAAVKGCGSSRPMDPCGYALYNLGASLRRSGHSREAIPVLVRRLRRFGDNERRDVRRELVAAFKGPGRGGGQDEDD